MINSLQEYLLFERDVKVAMFMKSVHIPDQWLGLRCSVIILWLDG
jgi:hypothetical protein